MMEMPLYLVCRMTEDFPLWTLSNALVNTKRDISAEIDLYKSI